MRNLLTTISEYYAGIGATLTLIKTIPKIETNKTFWHFNVSFIVVQKTFFRTDIT